MSGTELGPRRLPTRIVVAVGALLHLGLYTAAQRVDPPVGLVLLALAPTLLGGVLGLLAADRRIRGSRLLLDGEGVTLHRRRGPAGGVRLAWSEVTAATVHRVGPYRSLLVATGSGLHGLELTGWWVPTARVRAALAAAAPAHVRPEVTGPVRPTGQPLVEVRPRYVATLAGGTVLLAGGLLLARWSPFGGAVVGLLGALLVALALARRRADPVLRVSPDGLDLRIWSRRGWDVHRDWDQVVSVEVEAAAGSWWLRPRFTADSGDPDPGAALSAASALAPHAPLGRGGGYALNGFAFRPSPDAVLSAARRAAPVRSLDW